METKKLRNQWEAEIHELVRQRTEIDNKILGFETMIKGLDRIERGAQEKYKLAPFPLPDNLAGLLKAGLTDAIRLILRDAIHPLTPRQMRERLEMYGYTKLPVKNPMAAVHGVIRRMLEAGDVKEIPDATGKKQAYKLVSPMEKAISEMATQPKGSEYTFDPIMPPSQQNPKDDVEDALNQLQGKKRK
jgi:hypothetical protein